MDENKVKKNVIDMAVVNTDHLTFVKNGVVTQDGAFTVSVFQKAIQDSEQFAIMFFIPQPQPKVILFLNVNYNAEKYENEIKLYKQYISQTTGVDYGGGMGIDSKLEVKLDVQGYTTKQEVDENGQPVFNEDGTPKMVNKPFTVAEAKMN